MAFSFWLKMLGKQPAVQDREPQNSIKQMYCYVVSV